MKLTGLIDVRGPGGANAGNVTIVTTGMTALAYSQERWHERAVINASSSNASGGRVSSMADGMVSFAKGSVTADGPRHAAPAAPSTQTTAGDVSVQIPLIGVVGHPSPIPNGSIMVATPGNP